MRDLSLGALGSVSVLRSIFSERWAGLMTETPLYALQCSPISARQEDDQPEHRELSTRFRDRVSVLIDLFLQGEMKGEGDRERETDGKKLYIYIYICKKRRPPTYYNV